MTITTKLVLGFAAATTVTLAVGVSGYLGLKESLQRQRETVRLADETREAVDAARSAQVSFKIQVQEWKNVLLRGSSAAAFEKHWEGFVKEENETSVRLGGLTELLPQIGLSNTNVLAAREACA